MQNVAKVSPTIFLNLGGKERGFGYTMDSILQLQALTGKRVMKNELDPMDPYELSVLVWAGLIPWDETLDGPIECGEDGKPGLPCQNISDALKAIQKWIHWDMLAEIGQKVNQAFSIASPDSSKKK